MAAKKGKNKRAKSSEEAKPDQPASQADDTPETPAHAAAVPVESQQAPSGPPVAGIGASAGGLDAFKKFFTAMPADSGVGFVLIPHLDPRHESLMVELIARHTAMPVAEAADGMSVEANHVYVIPPNKYMTIAHGILRLSGPVERGGPQTSIDLFLRSLGEDKEERAICIILSGTGAHGALGLKAVKAAGGMAMVQDPDTADYPAMPQSAIATDLADFVLPVEQMPKALTPYLQHAYVNGVKAGAERKEAVDEMNQVLALVRARTRLDFRHYRKKMLARRIERRMSLCQFNCIADYLPYLRDHPDELRHLSRDLLISVTSFFRDPDAWQTLAAQVIAPLLRAREPDTPIRVWCAGCATGEEPYSLGILLLEQLAAAQKSCPVQIFATDVDDDSLDVARRAVYPESISADVSPERLSRFFTRVSESSYQVSKQLRETVIFARQNLINDAPFSKLDLVVCRYLLIYLEQEVQKKVIGLLHFALNENGALFLGSSETIGRNIDLFEPVSAKWRIYRRIGPVRPNNLQFPVAQVEPREAKTAAPPGKPQAPPRLPELAQNFLLRRFALACVVINRNYEILHFAGPTEDYLIQPGGPPTHDLLALARPGLDSKLRVVVQRAIRENSAQGIKDVMMRQGNVSRRVNIDVEPLTLSKQTEGLLLIAFQEQANPTGETIAEAKVRTQTAESDLMRQLEQELETTREDLQSTIEEMESSNEELKASNEEIMSMNEELQSANEELETSKEELQSLNEELSTVNNQLHDKVSDLETANNDITNLLDCTDIATVFLDRDFRVKRFTPVATRLFNLIASDIGRPIGDITCQFTDADLLGDARRVLRELAPREKEVTTQDGTWLRRIMPYRTRDDRIEGVVLTFSDVTELRRTDAALREQLTSEAGALTKLHQASSQLWQTQDLHEGLDVILAAAIELVAADKGNVQLLDAECRVLHIAIHRGFEQPFLDYFREVSAQDDSACGRALRSGSQIIIEDVETDVAFASLRPIASAAGYRAVVSTPLLGRSGRPLGIISMHFHDPHRPSEQELHRLELYARRAADFIERCRIEEALHASEEQLRKLNDSLERQVAERTQAVQEREARLRRMMESAQVGIAFTDCQGRIVQANRTMMGLVGWSEEDLRAGRLNCGTLCRPEDQDQDRQAMTQLAATGSVGPAEKSLIRTDGTQVPVLISALRLDGNRDENVTFVVDLTLQKQADEAVRDREARLRAILDSTTDAIITIDHQGIIQSVNPGAERMFGYTVAEMVGKSVNMLMPSPHREAHDGHIARYLQTGVKHIIGTTREVPARRKDGSIFPTELSVNEIPPLKLFTGIHRDITERKRLERELVEVASQQQRQIGQDLHDTVSQELTALGIQAVDLSEALRTDPAQAAQLAEQITKGLQRSQQELRNIMRGLLPVSVDAEGLMAALSDLSDRTQSDNKTACTFHCSEPVSVEDNLAATHLYLIAQEAVHNALKHGRPRQIRIGLEVNDLLTLSIEDDGAGMTDVQAAVDAGGLGLRIMRNRAAIIGATLTIEPARPTGTRILCTIPRKNHGKKENHQAIPDSDRR